MICHHWRLVVHVRVMGMRKLVRVRRLLSHMLLGRNMLLRRLLLRRDMRLLLLWNMRAWCARSHECWVKLQVLHAVRRRGRAAPLTRGFSTWISKAKGLEPCDICVGQTHSAGSGCPIDPAEG